MRRMKKVEEEEEEEEFCVVRPVYTTYYVQPAHEGWKSTGDVIEWVPSPIQVPPFALFLCAQ